MKTKLKNLIDYALNYLLANSDNENVMEYFKKETGSIQPIDWGNFVQQAQMEIWD